MKKIFILFSIQFILLNPIFSENITKINYYETLNGNVKSIKVYHIEYGNNQDNPEILKKYLNKINKFNKKGLMLEESYMSYDFNESYLESIRCKYDRHGNVIETKYFRSDLLINRSKTKYTYDKNDNVVEKYIYSNSGELFSFSFIHIEDKKKVTTTLKKSSNGDIDRIEILNEITFKNGTHIKKLKVMDKDGQFIRSFNIQYDKYGNIIKDVGYDKKRKDDNDYEFKLSYNSNAQVIKKIMIKNRIKVYTFNITYNEKGQIASEIILEHEKNTKRIKRYIYDKYGNWIYCLEEKGMGEYREIKYH